MSKTSDRINKAAAGIEADVVSLTERLETTGEIDAEPAIAGAIGRRSRL